MAVVHRTRVIRKISDRQLLDRALTAAQKWGKWVTTYYILPRTPMRTGELRLSLDDQQRITTGKNISMTWYARADHAKYLEDVKRFGAHIAAIQNFTTPDTEAPFLLPNIKRAMPTIRKVIEEMCA